jgi:hypothetical protein
LIVNSKRRSPKAPGECPEEAFSSLLVRVGVTSKA